MFDVVLVAHIYRAGFSKGDVIGIDKDTPNLHGGGSVIVGGGSRRGRCP